LCPNYDLNGFGKKFSNRLEENMLDADEGRRHYRGWFKKTNFEWRWEMKLSKSLIVLAAIALGLLTIASAKVMAVNHGSVGTGCRTVNPDGTCA
jgi:hypothetical protein